MPEPGLTGQVNGVVLTIRGVGLAGTTSRDDAERQVIAWIERAEIAAQQAPSGHPVFAALERGNELLALLQDEEAAIPETIAAGTDLYSTIDRVIDNLISASAEVRNAPDLPLPRTLFATPKTAVPWIEIAAGGAALAAGWWLFRNRRRRRK